MSALSSPPNYIEEMLKIYKRLINIPQYSDKIENLYQAALPYLNPLPLSIYSSRLPISFPVF